MRKLFIAFGVFLATLCPSVHAADNKDCVVKAQQDIIIDDQKVTMISQGNVLTIYRDGEMKNLNDQIAVSPAARVQAIAFQEKIRRTIPAIESNTKLHLDDLRSHFDAAITEHVGEDSSLRQRLSTMYSKLNSLLKTAINTQNGVTVFYHQRFNEIMDKGEDIVKSEFYGIVKDSFLQFKVIKNFNALRSIGKNEWKQKKEPLKQFNLAVCREINALEIEKASLIKTINSSRWLNQK